MSHSSRNLSGLRGTWVWWALVPPSIIWAGFFLGVLDVSNPIYDMMAGLSDFSVQAILFYGAMLIVLPVIASAGAFVKFSQSRSRSHAREGNMRLFGAGIAGAVMTLWGLLLFIIPSG